MRLRSRLFSHLQSLGYDEDVMLQTLLGPVYWDRKLRILILTLATFVALC